ncbi:MAG: hypothetical protein K1X65_22355 [Caldilineales bacterium]|nr:hypothetical protein [Caldilineales bacterium]MCW5859014.1 hypothetical protein [Caldilineales bacterium]
MTNLLPAILLAATPHNGKSVLAYLLTRGLRQRQIDHILLRTAPDGEGDWFYESPDEVRIRLRHKGAFTAEHVARMRRAIQNRHLPMLVDIGGKPRDDQLDLLSACTHVVHLYRDEADRSESAQWLQERSLIPVASLQSQLHPADAIHAANGILGGIISGLDRDHPRPGSMFDALLARVEGICSYPKAELSERHLAAAPAGVTLTVIDELAHAVGAVQPGGDIWFEAEHLPAILARLPAAHPLALYGRTPMWLASAIAAHAAPASFYWFDARHYGWIEPPPVTLAPAGANEEFTLTAQPEGEATRLIFASHYSDQVLFPLPIQAPALPSGSGVIFDGKMPGWLFAALARAYRHHPWLATLEPRTKNVFRFWATP